jgi:hypothetical protein
LIDVLLDVLQDVHHHDGVDLLTDRDVGRQAELQHVDLVAPGETLAEPVHAVGVEVADHQPVQAGQERLGEMAQAGTDLQHGAAHVRGDHVELVLPVVLGLVPTQVVLQGLVAGRGLHYAVIPRHAVPSRSLTENRGAGATATDRQSLVAVPRERPPKQLAAA